MERKPVLVPEPEPEREPEPESTFMLELLQSRKRVRELEAQLELQRSRQRESALELELGVAPAMESTIESSALVQSREGAGGTPSAWLAVCWGVVSTISLVVCGVCRSCGVGACVLPTIPSLLLHTMCHPRGHDWGLPQSTQRPSFLSWFVATTLCAIVAVGVGGACVHFIPYLWYPP